TRFSRDWSSDGALPIFAARSTFGQQLEAQQNLVRNTREYVDFANQRYEAGVDNYLILLDAQRLLFSSQQQLLQDQLAQRRSAIRSEERRVGKGCRAR